MKRPGLFVFNVALALALGTLYTLLVVERAWAPAAAWRHIWWASLLVGLAVAVGATFGPRPALGWKKSLTTQVWIVLSSALFALLLWLLPRELTAVDRLMEAELEKRGLRTGSGIGAAVGTAVQMVQVYFTRRRAARRP